MPYHRIEPIGVRGLLERASTVYMRISDKIEVATSVIDEATILGIKVTIAMPFNKVRQR